MFGLCITTFELVEVVLFEKNDGTRLPGAETNCGDRCVHIPFFTKNWPIWGQRRVCEMRVPRIPEWI